MTGSIIEAAGVTKTYKSGEIEVCALDNVTVHIAEGEFVALMGPSGSGKTTLLNMIAGIDKPTKGRISVSGRDISAMNDRQLTSWRTSGIGYIFQFYNLIPVLTAYENVELPLLAMNLSKAERHEHVLTALEAVGIAGHMKHLPRQLSGGQEQRVAIARAIVTDTQILVADEPTGNLDADSEKEIMSLLSELNSKHGKTIIMVTHDATAAKYAGRIIKLEKGRLAAPA